MTTRPITLFVQKRCQRELKALEKEIAQADKRLDSAKKALDEKQAVTEGLLRRSNEAQRRQEVSHLCNCLGISNKFSLVNLQSVND